MILNSTILLNFYNDDHSYTVFTKALVSSINIQHNINLQVLFITCHSSTFEFPTPNPANNLVLSQIHACNVTRT